MAHYDVVPVTPGTEADWKHPPFDGVIADDAVWGRGSVDDKGTLVAIFEAVEALAASGFKPRRTVLILSGHDEEAGGSGARAVAEQWKSSGIRPSFALDEGLAVVADMPLLGRPVALIGVAEKGYATLRITAPAKGGHSSAPPPETGVEVLAKAVLGITSQPFPMRFDGPGADMVRALAPDAGFTVKMAVANDWLFAPLLVRKIAATPAGAASLHTTIAPTMLRGSPKENVLPQDATAWINYRIAPGQTAAQVMEHARSATKDLEVELAWEGRAYDPPPVSSDDSDAYRLIAALASDGGKLPVAPGLVTATTDSRSLAGIAQNVYRFSPMVASHARVRDDPRHQRAHDAREPRADDGLLFAVDCDRGRSKAVAGAGHDHGLFFRRSTQPSRAPSLWSIERSRCIRIHSACSSSEASPRILRILRRSTSFSASIELAAWRCRRSGA